MPAVTKFNLNNTVQPIIEKRKIWEAGSYAASNTELYSILGECLDLYNILKSDSQKTKGLTDYLKQVGFAVQSNTSLELRIVSGYCNESCFSSAAANSDSEGPALPRIRSLRPRRNALLTLSPFPKGKGSGLGRMPPYANRARPSWLSTAARNAAAARSNVSNTTRPR